METHIVAEEVKVVRALERRFDRDSDYYFKHGKMMPDLVREAIR